MSGERRKVNSRNGEANLGFQCSTVCCVTVCSVFINLCGFMFIYLCSCNLFLALEVICVFDLGCCIHFVLCVYMCCLGLFSSECSLCCLSVLVCCWLMNLGCFSCGKQRNISTTNIRTKHMEISTVFIRFVAIFDFNRSI